VRGRDTEPIVTPYTREDLEAALSTICPHNWHEFFESRVYQVNPKPPIEGIEAAGWRTVYNDTPSHDPFWWDLAPFSVLASSSIGVVTEKDGPIFDVVPGLPAYDAGLGPHMTILAVNGHVYSADSLTTPSCIPQTEKSC
jgi:predicted metalloprotease with PDZ domain